MKLNFDDAKKFIVGAGVAASTVGGLEGQEVKQNLNVNNNDTTEIFVDKSNTSVDKGKQRKLDQQRINDLENELGIKGVEKENVYNLDDDLENFKSECIKYKDYGMFMSCNIVSEKPNEYQLIAIKNMRDRVIKELEGKNFTNTSDIILFINNAINNNFNEQNNPSINIKDAFPENDELAPKGDMDCDARSVLTLSILEKIGMTDGQVSLCNTKGHMFLQNEQNKQFIEMTDNTIKELNVNEKIELSKIDSFNKYYAYILGKKGVELYYEGNGNLFVGKNGDMQKLKESLLVLEKSIKLDPDNITNNYNYLRLLGQIGNTTGNVTPAEEAFLNIEKLLVKNHFNSDNTNTEITNNSEEELRIRKLADFTDINEATLVAMREDPVLKNKISELGDKLYFDLYIRDDNTAKIYENLSNSINKSELKNPDKLFEYVTYKRYAAESYLCSGQYKKFLTIANNDVINNMQNDEYSQEYLSELKSEIMVAKILSGEIDINTSNEKQIKEFIELVKNDKVFNLVLFNKTASGSFSMNAEDVLRKWPGLEQFKAKILNFLEK